MSQLFYSVAAEKKLATYLCMLADKELGAAFLSESFDALAHGIVRQIMRDNDEITGYAATLAEIKLEKEL